MQPRSVAFVVSRIPHEPFDGAMYLVYHQLRELRSQGCHVTLIAANTSRHHVTRDVAERLCDRLVLVDIDTSISWKGALLALFRRGEPLHTNLPCASYQLQRFFSQPLFDAFVQELQSHPVDVVHADGLAMAWYAHALRLHLREKSPAWVYRAHNIEYRILEHQAVRADAPVLHRWYYRLLAWQTRRFERAILQCADVVSTVTDVDAEQVRGMAPAAPIVVAPPGMHVGETSRERQPGQRLGFLGSLEWGPNVEGVLWFVQEVLPLILQKLPTVELHVAGRSPSPEISALHDGEHVHVIGPVVSAPDFLSSIDVAIAPVLSGSGVRIKILEGLAVGCAMVSTSRGAEGIPVVSGEHVVIADDPQTFADACCELLLHPEQARMMAERGQLLVAEQYAWKPCVERLRTAYELAIRQRLDAFNLIA